EVVREQKAEEEQAAQDLRAEHDAEKADDED
ncbi:type 1 glutamine amidotransferase domain-containing protein, partial [Kocuria rhizophila]